MIRFRRAADSFCAAFSFSGYARNIFSQPGRDFLAESFFMIFVICQNGHCIEPDFLRH
jgi:hypothetical protein